MTLGSLSEYIEPVARILAPRSFLALKSRLFFTLSISIAVQLGVDVQLRSPFQDALPILTVKVSDASFGVVLCCVVAVGFLLMADLILIWRRSVVYKGLLAAANNSALPADLRAQLVHAAVDGMKAMT